MKAKVDDHLVASEETLYGIYDDNGIYCEPEKIRIVKIPKTYHDLEDFYRTKKLVIEVCQFPNLKKLLVPIGVDIQGTWNLPTGCEVERY